MATKQERVDLAIGNLRRALADYDERKRDHAETTQELTEAKKRVDECARAVTAADEDLPLLDGAGG